MKKMGRNDCYGPQRDSTRTTVWLTFQALLLSAEGEGKNVRGVAEGFALSYTQVTCSKTPQSQSSRSYILTDIVVFNIKPFCCRLCSVGLKKMLSYWRGSEQALEINNHNLIRFAVEKQRFFSS